MTSNMSDRILRFIPTQERFISYPSPTRVTWLRDLVFTEDGKVCSSSSNLPAYAIEDGVPSFICIDPDGADEDRGRLAQQPKRSGPAASRCPARSSALVSAQKFRFRLAGKARGVD